VLVPEQNFLAHLVFTQPRPVVVGRDGPLLGSSRGWLQTHHVIDHGNTRDPRTLQQEHGVALLLAENRHQDIVYPDFILSAGIYVEHSALQHALKAELRLRRVLLAWNRYPPQSVGRDVLLEVHAELIEVSAASFEHLAYRRGIEDREQ
jgi:hypothetical protein